MRLRTAKPEDAGTVTAILAASYGTLLSSDYPAAALDRALPAMNRANSALLESGSYFLVEAEGRAAACGGWTREAPGTGEIREGEGHIRHFATHPDFARMGAAAVILRHCVAEAQNAGIVRLHALSTLTAVPFYSAHGFVSTGPQTVMLEGTIPFESVAMTLELDRD